MERDRMIMVVEELKNRLNIELGINPMTQEKGLKIGGLPSEYDLKFINDNREEIINIMENELSEVEVSIKLKKSQHKELLIQADTLEISLERYIKLKLLEN